MNALPDDGGELIGRDDVEELKMAIAAVQSTIEQTEVDATRTRMKSVLRVLQRLEQRLKTRELRP